MPADRARQSKVVANLPYAISTPWMDAVLSGPLPVRLVLMLQKEAASRYGAQPGGGSFGAISIFLQAAYDIAPGHRVSPACFHPRPDVDSALLHLVRKEAPYVFSAADKAVVRRCFQQRRKQIGAVIREQIPGPGVQMAGTSGGRGILNHRESRSHTRCHVDQARFAAVKGGLKAGDARPSLGIRTMLRAFALILLTAAAPAIAQEEAPTLVGSVDNGVYTSPTGAFKISIPVLRELGGVVHDTANVVTFHDSFGLQISVGAFEQDATMRWELSTRGNKDYLVYFLGTYILPDFKRFCPDTHVESAGFSSDFLDGTLFAYILLPGGSMFDDSSAFGAPGTPPVAKRGNAIFVRNGYTFVISTELSERVTEGSHYNKTVQEEDQILRNRLAGIVGKMQFTKPAKALRLREHRAPPHEPHHVPFGGRHCGLDRRPHQQGERFRDRRKRRRRNCRGLPRQPCVQHSGDRGLRPRGTPHLRGAGSPALSLAPQPDPQLAGLEPAPGPTCAL